MNTERKHIIVILSLINIIRGKNKMDIFKIKLNLKKECIVISLFLFANIFCLILTGCSDDDWADYEEKVEDVSIGLESNICNLDECQEELRSICSRYAKDLLIVHAEYIFSKNNENCAVISLSKNYEKNNVEYTILCELYVDMGKNTVTKIKYIDGHSKRVSSYSVELNNEIGIQADELYDDVIEILNSKKIETMEETQISYYSDRININSYNVEGEKIYCNSITQK